MKTDTLALLASLAATQLVAGLALLTLRAMDRRHRSALLRWTGCLGAQGSGFAAYAVAQITHQWLYAVAACALLALGMCLAIDAVLRLARQTLPRWVLGVLPVVVVLAHWGLPLEERLLGHPVVLLGLAHNLGLALLALRPANRASIRARICLACAFALGAGSYWVWLHASAGSLGAGLDGAVFVALGASSLLASLMLVLIHTERDDRTGRQLATVDGLTGAYNRGTLIELGQRELARAMRRERPISLLMVQADPLPEGMRTSPTASHRVRMHLTELMTCSLQRQDLFGYFGGEEFCAVLPDTPLEGARFVAERLCAQAHSVSHTECGIGYTVSIGLAESAPSEMGFEQIVARADAALRRAQEKGGQRIEVDDSMPASRAEIRDNGAATELGLTEPRRDA